ncbi:hypothetical protein [Bowmanella denitrificans]|uniref:hypothetical protein n=1 Tax=Bowmanella denitrificans TaxID=366582 RepID=UPI000C9AD585|nr:hypothetical protein [Bowmanella denitrificans]
MLDEQIRQSRQASSLGRKKALLIAGLIVVLLLLALFLIRGLQSPPVPETVAQQNVDPQVQEQARQAFKQALLVFEQDIDPVLQQPQLINWQKAQVASLQADKQQALADFAAGDSVSALSRLAKISDAALALQQQWHAAYQQKLTEAQLAFAEGRIRQSQLLLNQGGHIQSHGAQAEALQQRLDVFAQVEQLLKDAQIAEAENDLGKQVALLEQAKSLDPARHELDKLLSDVKTRWRDLQFSNLIEQGFDLLRQNDLQGATTKLEQARKLDSQRPETKVLATQIQATSQSQGLTQLLEQIQAATVADNWQQVAVLTSAGLKRFPNHQQLLQNHQLAGQINKASSRLKQFMADPQRLQDSGIADAARQTLVEYQTLGQYSFNLTMQMQSLEQALTDNSQAVSLNLQSDGKTQIQVVGVGQVGQVSERTLQLPPGDYVLLGSREGYRDKRLPVHLQPGGQAVTLILVCDERI